MIISSSRDFPSVQKSISKLFAVLLDFILLHPYKFDAWYVLFASFIEIFWSQ